MVALAETVVNRVDSVQKACVTMWMEPVPVDVRLDIVDSDVMQVSVFTRPKYGTVNNKLNLNSTCQIKTNVITPYAMFTRNPKIKKQKKDKKDFIFWGTIKLYIETLLDNM